MFMGSFMKADRKLDSIYELDPVFLKARGMKGIIFDIDNTLEEYAAKEPGERSVALIRRLGAAGFRIGILSNASHKRAEAFLNGFPKTDYPEILMVSKAGKPLKSGFLKLVGEMGIRPQEAVMVGDQLYTDIWGGNRCGCYTILVNPINTSIEPAFVRFKRLIEKPFM